MDLFDEVPVAEVNCENIGKIWPYLISSIHQSQLIAIDLELSGLGERGRNPEKFSERYKYTREAAKTRTVLSIGIATFKQMEQTPKCISYRCKAFDFLAHQTSPFVVEPDALTFLSSHGFDFNRMLTHGIKYSKISTNTSTSNIFKSLWEEILASGVSIALHNGLNDLAFIHEHFYSQLPEEAEQFISDIADWFGEEAGMLTNIWDSKHLATQDPRFECSYLEYVFRKAQRENYRRMISSSPHISIRFSRFRPSIRGQIIFSKIKVPLPKYFLDGMILDGMTGPMHIELCASYKNFGHCRNRSKCDKEHDVDAVLDMEDRKVQLRREKERKRRNKKNLLIIEDNKSNELEVNNGNGAEIQRIGNKRANDQSDSTEKKKKKVDTSVVKTEIAQNGETDCHADETTCNGHSIPVGTFASRGHHRAGMDAFMTGFATIFFNADYAVQNDGLLDATSAGYIPLPGGKALLLKKGKFSRQQKESHTLNWERINSRRRAFAAAKLE